MQRRGSQFGFTLIEVLVALSLLVLVSLGVIQLVLRSKQVADVGGEQFVAANLAREGVELVRSLRDTTWFTDDDRSHWISDAMCGTFTYDIDRLHNGDFEVGAEDEADILIQDDGHFSHASLPDSVATPFARVLEVDCSEREGNPPYVTVIARVSWENRGQPREVLLKEKLYNWLP